MRDQLKKNSFIKSKYIEYIFSKTKILKIVFLREKNRQNTKF